MANTIEFKIRCNDPLLKEILLADLFSLGAEGIEEEEDGINAYFQENESVELEIDQLLDNKGLNYQRSLMESRNWNQSWESNFEPVVVEDLVGIRADFHDPIPGVQYELLITPKMSFGTGHHATTHLMIRAMMDLDMKGKTVLDFGTGTGVLAILAEKLDADAVLAIDNDEWSILNCRENLNKNGCRHILLNQAEELLGFKDPFDIILANINRHVILDNLASLKRLLKQDGVMLLSGLLKEDRQYMEQAFLAEEIRFITVWERGDWICIKAAY